MASEMFYHGQGLKEVFWGKGRVRLGGGIDGQRVASIEVVMEGGQMGLVPWALVTHEHGVQHKYNLALVEGVVLQNTE